MSAGGRGMFAAFSVAVPPAEAEAGLRVTDPTVRIFADTHISATARRLELPRVPRTNRARFPTGTAAAPLAEIVPVVFTRVIGRAVCGRRRTVAFRGVPALDEIAGTALSPDGTVNRMRVCE